MHLFLWWLLCLSAARGHTVTSDLVIQNPAVFQDSLSVQGSTNLNTLALSGTLDMQNNAIANLASAPPVVVTTSSSVAMNTGATLFVVNPLAGNINVMFTDMQLYTAYRVIMDGSSGYTVMVNFTTDAFSMSQPGSYLVVMLLDAGLKVLNDGFLVTRVMELLRVRLADPIGGLTGHPEYVAMSDDGKTMVTSSTMDNNMFGIAFVFTRSGNTWSYVQSLTASDGVQFDAFGSCLAVNADGTTILVGANMANGYIGTAYIFTLSGTWNQEARLDPAGGPAYLGFGSVAALSASGDHAVVGISDMSSTGIAFVFTRSGVTWSPVADLTAEANGFIGDAFGTTVDISGPGTTIIVGARDANPSAVNRAAYVFTDSGTWTRQEKIAPPPTVLTEITFGTKVALSTDGDTAAITSPGTDSIENGVYMYTRSGTSWTFVGMLPNAPVVLGDMRGNHVMVSDGGNTVAMASHTDAGPPTTNYVHLYTRSGSTWNYLRAIELNAGENTWMFGEQGTISDDGFTVALMTMSFTDPGWPYVFMFV